MVDGGGVSVSFVCYGYVGVFSGGVYLDAEL
jgi:hypothetical protein